MCECIAYIQPLSQKAFNLAKRLTKRIGYIDEQRKIKQGGCCSRSKWISISQWSQLVWLSAHNHAVRESIFLKKKKFKNVNSTAVYSICQLIHFFEMLVRHTGLWWPFLTISCICISKVWFFLPNCFSNMFVHIGYMAISPNGVFLPLLYSENNFKP